MKLIKRVKLLLSLLQETGGEILSFRMQKLLFLYCNEFLKNNEYYEFIPVKNSPYSLQAVEDKKSLIKNNLLEKSDDWILFSSDKRFATDLDFFEKMALQDLKNKFLQKTDEELAEYITENYSEYISKPHHADDDEIIFYTIGYEGLSPEAYINLLVKNKVRLLVDVRKNAFSQKYGFSKVELSRNLQMVDIEYRHVPDLGIVSEKRKELSSEKDYVELFREYEQTTIKQQQSQLDNLQLWLQEKRRIAITCFEAQPHHCHRSHITKALKMRDNFNYKIEHLQSCKFMKNQKLSERKFL